VVALHVIRRRVSPIGRRLSDYALGPDGWLMDVAFGTVKKPTAGLFVGVQRRWCTSASA
jgi:hypothetical protein